jgi:hypothetical protein
MQGLDTMGSNLGGGIGNLMPMIRETLMTSYASQKVDPIMDQISGILQPLMGGDKMSPAPNPSAFLAEPAMPSPSFFQRPVGFPRIPNAPVAFPSFGRPLYGGIASMTSLRSPLQLFNANQSTLERGY